VHPHTSDRPIPIIEGFRGRHVDGRRLGKKSTREGEERKSAWLAYVDKELNMWEKDLS